MEKPGDSVAQSGNCDWQFNTTHWSLVLRVGETDSIKTRDALASLCRDYWYPLYAYVRRRGYSKEDAEDLTQGFFANLLETNCLRKADPDRGRFRTFLRKCLDNFLANDWNKRKAAKRGGNCFFVSWSELGAEERYGQEPSDSLAADKLYDRRWVQALLEKVMAELRQEYLLSGKENRFMALQGCLSGASREESCQVLAEKLQMTEAAVKMERLRLRRRFAELLRLKIAETVEDANQLDAEFQCLFSIWD